MMQALNDLKATWQERALNPQPEPPGLTASKSPVAEAANA